MLNKSLSISYKIFPFFVGMYCYYPVFVDEAHSFPFLDAVYASIMLYSGSIESGVEVNGLLQLVRFLALATTLNR